MTADDTMLGPRVLPGRWDAGDDTITCLAGRVLMGTVIGVGLLAGAGAGWLAINVYERLVRHDR